MSTSVKIRKNWLKGMYVYTILTAGASGLAMLIAPTLVRSSFDWMAGESMMFSIVATIWLAFGLLSILGIREPLKFAPVLGLQMLYKLVWIVGVAVPRLIGGESTYVLPTVVFATFVVGDAIAVPFPYLLGARTRRQPSQESAN